MPLKPRFPTFEQQNTKTHQVPKPKLYKLLCALSKRELQDFRLFLLSPFHNQSQTLLALFDYIRPFHPDFTHKNLDKELIFNTLKPKKSYIQKYVNDRLSDLNHLLQDFLAVQYIKKNSKENRAVFRKSLLEHQCQVSYLQNTKKEIDKLELKPRLGWNSSLELWSLHHAVFSHPQTQLFNAKKDDALIANNYLDETYAILKLRYGLHNLFRKSIFSETITIPFLATIIEQHKTSKHPIIKLYLYALAYFNDAKQKETWESVCDLFLEQIGVLPPDEKIVFLFALANVGNKLARIKSPIYFDKILLLYQKGLEHEFWKFLGEFPSITFKNIAVLGASTKKFKWTTNFIDKYKQFLPNEEQIDTIAFASAYLEFYKGNFDLALDYINQSPLLKLEDKLTMRSLQCRCFYETENEILPSFLDTFARFINEQKIAKDTKQSYKNFIYFIRLLNKERGKQRISRLSKESLHNKIISRSHFIAYNWIQEKIEAL